MIKPPSQAAQSEWIMMGPAHSWCQCGQLSLCSNSLVVQWGAGARAGAGSGWAQLEYLPRPDPGRLSASGWSEGCRIRRIAAGSTQACGP